MLIALAAGEAHAYALEQRMIEDVKGVMLIQSRAVYRELPRLAGAGLIELVTNTRPVRYRLTPRGRKTLQIERGNALNIYRLLQARL